MSTIVSTEVRNRLSVSGGLLLLALEIADVVSHDGGYFFKSVETMSKLTRQSEATVRRQLKFFREVGWLVAVSGMKGGRNVTTRYRISLEWIRGKSLEKLPDGWFGDPEKNPVILIPFTPIPSHPVAERVSNDDLNPVTAVTDDPKRSVNNKSARPRAIPSGSRPAPKPRTPEERIAGARSMLAELPEYPHDTLRLIFALTDAELESVLGPSAEYSAGAA